MKPLKISDKIYGRFTVTEPVLIELIKSKSLRRLKGIDNRGAWSFHQSSPGSLSRYDHSLGVMLLLKKFGADPEEQVAGLLHDISHTAFSHVADFVFGSHTTHDYQDKKLAQAFELQGINKILKKHKINPERILDEKNFPRLEKKLPDLCADRIDYTFRDPWFKKITQENPKNILKNLAVIKNTWVFKNRIWAKKFASIYLKLDQQTWCTPLQTALYEILAQAIKLALAKKIITKKDLFTTDKILLAKLKQTKNKEILQKIQQLRNLKVSRVNKNQADFYTKSKPRVVDPYFLAKAKLVRLSSVDFNYKKMANGWLKEAKKGFWIKILNS